jgi:hypothetical protein
LRVGTFGQNILNLTTNIRGSSLENNDMGDLLTHNKFSSCFNDNDISDSYDISSEYSRFRVLYKTDLLKEGQKPFRCYHLRPRKGKEDIGVRF